MNRKEAHKVAHRVVEAILQEPTPADEGVASATADVYVNEPNEVPKQSKYTVAAQAWDQINADKRQLCVEQVRTLIVKDERLRLERKRVQEAIRQINTTDEPRTPEDAVKAGLFCGEFGEKGFPLDVSRPRRFGEK